MKSAETLTRGRRAGIDVDIVDSVPPVTAYEIPFIAHSKTLASAAVIYTRNSIRDDFKD